MSTKTQELADRLRKNFSGPMTEDEVNVLRDVQGFIDFAIRNGLSFALALGGLCHDINELARDGFDLKAAKARGFKPKVTGYAKINEESFGASEPLE